MSPAKQVFLCVYILLYYYYIRYTNITNIIIDVILNFSDTCSAGWGVYIYVITLLLHIYYGRYYTYIILDLYVTLAMQICVCIHIINIILHILLLEGILAYFIIIPTGAINVYYYMSCCC